MKEGGKILDGRTVENVNTSVIGSIHGPRGVYHVVNTATMAKETHHTYSFSGSFGVNHQFSVNGQSLLQKSLVQLITQHNPELIGRVTVKLNRHEEYLGHNG